MEHKNKILKFHGIQPRYLEKMPIFRSSNELKLAKAFSSVTSDDKEKCKTYTRSFQKSVTNSPFPFTTKLPITNSGKSSVTESKNTLPELCQKCRRAVDRYSKCSVRFNFKNFSLVKCSHLKRPLVIPIYSVTG